MRRSFLNGHIIVVCLVHILATNAQAGEFSREPLPVKFFQNLIAGKHQTVVVYGTSLSQRAEWPNALNRYFAELFPGQVTVHNSASSGKTSDWGLKNIESRVLSKNPDLVFIEFAINDSATKHGISVEQGIINLDTMMNELRKQNPDVEIVLQTMNPTYDTATDPGTTAASDRPDLLNYYESYRQYARMHNLPLIDHYWNWAKLRESHEAQFRLWLPDGTHPVAEGSLAITWTTIKAMLEKAQNSV